MKTNNEDPKNTKGGKKKWYKTWWGIALLVLCAWPFFLIWYFWAKTSWKTTTKALSTVGVVLFLFVMIATIGASSDTNVSNTKTATPTNSTTEKKEEPKKEEAAKPAEPKITVPKYELVYTLDKARYDGGKGYYVLIDPINLSDDGFKNSVKALVKKITDEKGININIEIHDNSSSLNYSYEQYGTKTLIPTQAQKDVMAIHFIASYSGGLKENDPVYSLDFFPATFKDNPTVGKYVQSGLEFNPKDFKN